MPLLRDAHGRPLKRNFIHVEDLVAALAALDNPLTGNKLYNVCMDRPVDYGEVAAHLARHPRARLRRYSQPVSLELDGQQQGQIRARMAAPL